MTDRDPTHSALDASALARSLASMLVAGFGVGRTGRAIIAIAGESGSGKSVTAAGLARELTAAGICTGVLNQDNYFHRPPRTNHEYRLLDLRHVGPHEVNLDLLQSHADAFRDGREISGPLVDYPSNRFVVQEHDFSSLGALIIEGTYVFRLRDIDVRIFLEATHEDTRERRRVRARDIDAPIIDQILAIEHALIAPQAALAHIVIDQDFAIRVGSKGQSC
jgi:uridine kinase